MIFRGLLTQAEPLPRIDLGRLTAPERLGKFGSLGQSVQTVFTIAITIAGIIFLVLIVMGGIQYLTSGGNEEQTTAAKRSLISALVGLVITVTAWALGTFLLTRLGVGR